MDIAKKSVRFRNEFEVFGSAEDRYFNQLPAHDLSALFTFLDRHHDTFRAKWALDIGANIGLASLCIHDLYPESYIYSFEPSRLTFSLLDKNVSHNGLKSQIFPQPMAAGSAEGQISFLDDQNYLAGSGAGTGEGSYEVRVTTVDEFVKYHAMPALDFIKIDVEGYELSVLDGARDTLKRFRPAVFIECNPSLLDKTQTPLEGFLEYLTEALGELFVVDRLSGCSVPIGRGAGAAAAIRGLMETPWDVFDLVNRPS
ncbi:hypothetical protein sos41_14930 [Alphaproteobacteria bacterium SO-S41]|nr:hypothetical protein sos41_14930 [Alphaproteobacteria bacterium SO-S41]